MKARVDRIFEKLEAPAEALVLANSVEPHLDLSFFYLFDVPSGLFEGSVAVAHRDGRLDVLSSPLEAETAHQAAKDDAGVTVHVPETPQERDKLLEKLVPAEGPVALHFHELTHESFLQLEKLRPRATWVDASTAIRKARMVKDASEVDRLERAATIASRVAEEIPGMLKDGVTEVQVAAEIEHRMMAHGAAGRSFSTIVAFDVKGAEPHYQPQERPLKTGASIVCDFGAQYRRYASDITRSFRFGRADAELKRVHETVLEAQAAALGVVRAGLPAKEAHLAAQQVIDASPWKGRFTHGLGHSIGLAVHDGFSCGPRTEDLLEEGMAITVEPGIYLPGKGGVRIEDDILVTKGGYRFLTTAHREYLEVGA
jgi:Xaa-Pro aminopeptidase